MEIKVFKKIFLFKLNKNKIILNILKIIQKDAIKQISKIL
jgi:hypothetical protein